MADFVVAALLLLAASALAIRCFRQPRGVLLRSLAYAGVAIGGVLALLLLASPLLGSGAGMGIAFLFAAFVSLVASLVILAWLAAGARHLWDSLRAGRS